MNFDIFNNDAFSMTSMLEPVNLVGYNPQYLGSIPGLFVPQPVRTTGVWIESRSDGPSLIQTTERGTAPKTKDRLGRNARNFKTLRLAQADRINAEELQNMRAFGSENEVQTMQAEIAIRQQRLKNDFDLTRESWRLACLQGKVVDANNDLLYDWAVEFGQTLPAEINFDLTNASPAKGALRKKCNDTQRKMVRALKGQGGAGVEIHALCGDNFWDELTTHTEVERTYLNWVAATELRNGTAWSAMKFGDIYWHNYRGTDDNSTVAILTDKVKFFPRNAGIFRMAYSPYESAEFVNTLGQETYSGIVLDRDRKMWADVEMYSYPLPVCTMPAALFSGRVV
jgi:Phage major capsid protein E